MAKSSSKKIANSNKVNLANLRISLVAVNAFTLVVRVIFKLVKGSSLLPQTFVLKFLNVAVLAVTLAIARYFNRIGSPQLDASGRIIGNGEDLGDKGVIDLGWDTLYVSWACQVLSAMFSERFWYLWLAVPGIAIFKLYSTFAPLLRSLTGQATPSVSNGNDPVPPAGESNSNEQHVSKRQAKLQARLDRGDKRVQQKEVRRAA